MRYETTRALSPPEKDLIDILLKYGVLLKIEEGDYHATSKAILEVSSAMPILSSAPSYLKIEQEDNIPCTEGVDKFLTNHQAIEVNIEIISKENLGLCEDRKDWLKALKAAVKEYGHDQVLESFYEWSLAQGTFMGRRPVTTYLKNITNNISNVHVKPTVTNPVLSKVEERIAYISDNRVFFTGDYRIKLAGLLKDYGPELVVSAFEQFFQDVEDRSINWAARDFLQRASVMITIIQRKKEEVETQQRLQQAALAAAKEAVQEEPEEEDTEL